MSTAAVTLIVLYASASAAASSTNLKTRTAQTIVATWKCEDKLPRPHTRAYSPWKPHSVGFRRAQLNLWTKRLAACRAILAERTRQWDWQRWLPAHWQRVGQCETQLNWRHSNSSYQGAFGFAISSWDAYKLPGYPDEAWQASPWEQYQVALAIYRRFGMSGWGCKG